MFAIKPSIPLPRDEAYFVAHLKGLGRAIQTAVLHSLQVFTAEELSTVMDERGGDAIYRLDEEADAALVSFCDQWGAEMPFLLIAEGLEQGWRVFPATAGADQATFTLIADP